MKPGTSIGVLALMFRDYWENAQYFVAAEEAGWRHSPRRSAGLHARALEFQELLEEFKNSWPK
jgi:hypothetical protein